MATYGANITLEYRTKSKNATSAHSHHLKHGAFLEEKHNDRIIHWSITPDADDSIGSQGTLQFSIATEAGTYTFTIAFVCNNKLQNSVTMTYSAAHFDVVFNATPEEYLTQAPLNVFITVTEK